MAAQIPTSEPAFLYAGDTLQFTKSFTDYPATDGWALTYYFLADDGSGKKFQVPATASGTGFAVTYLTSNVEFARYVWRAKVILGAVSVTVATGVIDILPSLENGGDVRTQNRRTLDNINAVLEGRASSTIMESIVEGTRLNRIPHADLLKLRDRFKQIVLNEEAIANARAGNPNKTNIFTRFTTPR